MTPKYCFQFPHQHSETHDKVFRPNSARSDRQEDHQVREWKTQKGGPRKMGCKLISIQGVPFSFNTHWRDEGGNLDVDASIHVHEALEREFGIEIKDRNYIITDVESAYYIVTQHHDSVWTPIFQSQSFMLDIV